MPRKPKNPNAVKNFELSRIAPKTTNQHMAFRFWEDGYNLFLHGFAGTGKSFISCYLALRELRFGTDLLRSYSDYERLVIIRSAVPSRDMGFMPGTKKEKERIYEEPYEEIVNKLYNRGDAYQVLKNTRNLEFTTTSFLRGITFENSIIIVDEVQNMNWSELHTVMTRVGENSKIIFSGDFRQSDLRDSGLHRFMNVIRKMDEDFRFVEFNTDDIVRSGLVKNYIIKESEHAKMVE